MGNMPIPSGEYACDSNNSSNIIFDSSAPVLFTPRTITFSKPSAFSVPFSGTIIPIPFSTAASKSVNHLVFSSTSRFPLSSYSKMPVSAEVGLMPTISGFGIDLPNLICVNSFWFIPRNTNLSGNTFVFGASDHESSLVSILSLKFGMTVASSIVISLTTLALESCSLMLFVFLMASIRIRSVVFWRKAFNFSRVCRVRSLAMFSNR